MTPTTHIRQTVQTSWWLENRDQLVKLAQENSPLYIYHLPTISQRLEELKTLNGFKIKYALKANSCPQVIEHLHKQGVGFDCVSWAELLYLDSQLKNLDKSQVIFTPNFAPIEEYEKAMALGVMVNVDNVALLEEHPELFRGKEIIVRIDPDLGAGHHKHVNTSGGHSKFGIAVEDLDRLIALSGDLKMKIVGLHAHVGSGVLEADTWVKVAEFLKQQAKNLPEVRILDLGGGFGLPDKPQALRLDLAKLKQSLDSFRAANPQFELWIEPGRYLVAEAGVILARITQIKRKSGLIFVGLDAGMNALLRPALYGAYHRIDNLSRQGEAKDMQVHIVGPICESSDVLGFDRIIPASSRVGDVMVIAQTGAYGRVMASNYNQRQIPDELCI